MDYNNKMFVDEIKQYPNDAVSWLGYADSLDENGKDSLSYRSVGEALQNGGFINGANSEVIGDLGQCLREVFEIEKDEHNYAHYLITMGQITENAHTRLQGEYLLDYLDHHGERGAGLLQQIRRETRLIPGIEELADDDVTGREGRVDFNCREQKITRLPPGFHISGKADFLLCSNLTSIGNGFHAGGNADFLHCYSLASFGNGFHASGNATLRDCSSLTFIGNGFHAGGNADFLHCFSLESIGIGCQILGDLYLWGCQGLRSLPEDIRIGRDIINIPSCLVVDLQRGGYPNLSNVARLSLQRAMDARGTDQTPA